MGSDSFTGDWDKYFRTHYVNKSTALSSLPVQNLKVSSPTIDCLTLDTESVAEKQVVW